MFQKQINCLSPISITIIQMQCVITHKDLFKSCEHKSEQVCELSETLET
jgi:hypothetical protein